MKLSYAQDGAGWTCTAEERRSVEWLGRRVAEQWRGDSGGAHPTKGMAKAAAIARMRRTML